MKLTSKTLKRLIKEELEAMKNGESEEIKAKLPPKIAADVGDLSDLVSAVKSAAGDAKIEEGFLDDPLPNQGQNTMDGVMGGGVLGITLEVLFMKFGYVGIIGMIGTAIPMGHMAIAYVIYTIIGSVAGYALDKLSQKAAINLIKKRLDAERAKTIKNK